MSHFDDFELKEWERISLEMDAEEELFRDVDSFTDYVGAQCMGEKSYANVQESQLPYCVATRTEKLAAMPMNQLVYLTFNGSCEISQQAILLIKQRYAADKELYKSMIYTSKINAFVISQKSQQFECSQ